MSVEKIIIKSKDFDPSKLSFDDVKTMKDIGAKYANVKYDGKKLYMQTPDMYVPYGMSQFQAKEGEEKKPNENASWSLDLSFAGENDNSDLKDLHENLEKIEDILVDAAHEGKWFLDKKSKDKSKRNNSISKDMLRNYISDQVRYSKATEDDGKTPKYPPTMKVKVPCYNGTFSCDIFDETKTQITDRPPNEVLVKGCSAKCLLECGAVYLGGNKITLTWKLSQAKVRQSAIRVSGYGFIDSDDEGDEDGESNERPESTKPKAKKSEPTMIDSDEDDDDDDDDDNDDDSEDESDDE